MSPSTTPRPGPDPSGRGMGRARNPEAWRDADQSTAVIAEILAGPVVWGGVGWLGDRWLGTDPWLLAIGIMGGFAGGLYLVWLRLQRLRSTGQTAGAQVAEQEGERA